MARNVETFKSIAIFIALIVGAAIAVYLYVTDPARDYVDALKPYREQVLYADFLKCRTETGNEFIALIAGRNVEKLDKFGNMALSNILKCDSLAETIGSDRSLDEFITTEEVGSFLGPTRERLRLSAEIIAGKEFNELVIQKALRIINEEANLSLKRDVPKRMSAGAFILVYLFSIILISGLMRGDKILSEQRTLRSQLKGLVGTLSSKKGGKNVQ